MYNPSAVMTFEVINRIIRTAKVTSKACVFFVTYGLWNILTTIILHVKL